MAENPWMMLDAASVRIRELEAERDSYQENHRRVAEHLQAAAIENKALRRAVEAVQEADEVFSATPPTTEFGRGYAMGVHLALTRIDAALAAARIEVDHHG